MITNKQLQEFVNNFFDGDATKVTQLEITSSRFTLSEEEGLNLITPDSEPFWQIEDLSESNFPNLRDLCVCDAQIHGLIDLPQLTFCMLYKCPPVKLLLHGESYVARTMEKAWIYEYDNGKVKVSRE